MSLTTWSVAATFLDILSKMREAVLGSWETDQGIQTRRSQGSESEDKRERVRLNECVKQIDATRSLKLTS